MDRLAAMETFLRIVEAGSLSGAARQIGTSLAAVSRQLASLEQDLGVTLARRTTRRLEVTPAGRRYYEHALRIVSAMDEARQSVRRGDGLEGLLRVSVSVAVGRHRILPALPGWLAQHPNLAVDLLFDDRVVELVGEGIDLAVRVAIDLPDTTTLVARPLGVSRSVLCASPAYLARCGEPRTPAELAAHRLIGHPAHDRGRKWRLRRGDETVDLAFPCRIRTDDLVAAHTLVREGLGFAGLPAWQVARDLDEGTLRLLIPDWTLPELHVVALFRREPQANTVVRAFVDHLARTFTSSGLDAAPAPPVAAGRTPPDLKRQGRHARADTDGH